MSDPRIGKRGKDGEYVTRPTQTLSGAEIPNVHTTINLPDGHYVVTDTFISPEREKELVLEIKAVLAGSAKPSPAKAATVKESSES